ncbi:hypothetical protein OGAPHI_006139 [Ogataea philodendri]|uniref:Uncharacterized protein n=1 Tax=Ogataea philodendri TaxID=1378263 RepID=A0A9P8NYQ6_9ASCO|nr:uncharacterized protein OGAPHI_006139 [Ogataea philodendri]KAH3661960.1 hypothetical protein OGAPHI_006139 [Ogataea philodendri]
MLRTSAPPTVARYSTSLVLSFSKSFSDFMTKWFETKSACLATCNTEGVNPPEQSVPRLTLTLLLSSHLILASPEVMEEFDVGQCDTPLPVWAKRSFSWSDKWIQWARMVFGPSRPDL